MLQIQETKKYEGKIIPLSNRQKGNLLFDLFYNFNIDDGKHLCSVTKTRPHCNSH